MKKNKIIIFSIILASLLISGFGCKGLTAEEKSAIKPVTINYWTIFNDVGLLNQFAAEYKQERPYVTIKIKKVRVEEFEDLLVNALADDVGPDIVSIHVRDLNKYRPRLSPMPEKVNVANVYVKGQYSKETVVVPLEIALISVLALKSNFVGTVYDDVVFQNKIYGLPLAIDTMALYYNKDLLDQAGVPVAPTTWEELMEAIKATTRFNEKGDIIQAGASLGTGENISRSFDILSLLMIQGGVKIAVGNAIAFDSGLKTSSDQHPTMAALRFYTDFANPLKDVYTWNEKMGESLDEFARGKVAFYFGFAYDYPRIKAKAPQMNLDIIPVPQLNPQKPVNVANYYMESVVGKSKNKDEAWDFIRFMTTPDNIKKYTTATKRPTPLRSQIKEQEEDLVLAPFVGTVLQAENWYHGRDSAVAEKAFNNLIHNYLQPAGGNESEIKKNVELIQQTAQVVQQTM
ncbi:extracellular solute-binding protein [Patescibacteria group bacterium]|nr:extracellular solute-binding protein [Patescibacteria group bacterium]